LIQGAYTNISAYVGGTLLVATSAGVTMVVSLLILGLPFAGPLGLWMFLFGIIPLVGATIGAVPAIIVAFVAEDGGTAKGLILIAIVVGYQQLENLVIQPAIQGRVVSLPPIVIFLSVLIGSQLLGVLGALVAVPMAGIIQIFIKQLLDARDDNAPMEPLPVGPNPPEPPVIDVQA
jgi:predicted PurR-regulated permease PerM